MTESELVIVIEALVGLLVLVSLGVLGFICKKVVDHGEDIREVKVSTTGNADRIDRLEGKIDGIDRQVNNAPPEDLPMREMIKALYQQHIQE